MRIALVVPGGVDKSGRERVIPALLWLIERLAQRHQVYVFALRQYPTACNYTLLGATVHNLGDAQFKGKKVPVVRWYQGWRAFTKAVNAAAPFDVLHGIWAGTPGLFAALAGRRLNIPTVVSINGGELVALPKIGYGGQLRKASRLQVAMALKLAGRVTIPSRYIESQARAYGASSQEIAIGVDTRLFFQSDPAPEGPPWRLLHVGSLNRIKDQGTLLRALQRVVKVEPQVHLDIVGEDTLNGTVQSMCADLGLTQKVTFHGFLPVTDVAALYRGAHLFVLTSRHEAGPVVMLEAAVSGVPTVGTCVGFVADWAPHRAMAVVVGDADGLAQGVLALIGDPERRRRLGRAAQAWALAHDADWTAAQFEGIYAQLCA